MSRLERTQAWMTELLRHRRALPSDPEIAREARQYLSGNDRLSAVEQLEIYREQFWLRHTGSLLEDFPGLSGVIGQADWERLVEGYLTEHTPSSWTLRDLGRNLPHYVEQHARYLKPHRLCVDMARLEWAYIELFDAPESSPLDARKVAGIPADAWERVRLTLSPALRLLEVAYPVADLRRALRASEARAVPIPDPKTQWLVLYRGKDRRLFHKPVSEGAFALLSALQEGAPLGDAADQAARRVAHEADHIESNVGEWFTDWGRRGWITDVVPP